MQDKMKLANDQFLAATTGYFNGQKTFDREKFEQTMALDSWKFISGLTGASNAFKQARAIGSMPNGMGDLMGALAGKYNFSSGTSVGSSGGHFNLDEMMQGYGGNFPQPVAPGSVSPGQPGQPTPAPPPTAVPTAPPTPPVLQPMPGQPTTPITGPIPGRGFDPGTQWNAATKQAALAWEAAHPGYKLDGSQVGYRWVGVSTPGDEEYVTNAQNAGITYSPPGAQAPANAYNYSQAPDGSTQVYPPGVASPAATPDVSSHIPQNPQDAAALMQPYSYGAPYIPKPGMPGVGTTITDTQVGGTGLDPNAHLLPNQINARNYNNAYQYQQELAWAEFEDQGWDKGLAQEAFLKSLPKYGGVSKGAIAF
jgi:hypothetical protein